MTTTTETTNAKGRNTAKLSNGSRSALVRELANGRARVSCRSGGTLCRYFVATSYEEGLAEATEWCDRAEL